MEMGDEVHWPGLDVLNIFSNSGQDLGRSFPGLAGSTTLPGVYDALEMRSGKVSPKAGVESIWLGFVDRISGYVSTLTLS